MRLRLDEAVVDANYDYDSLVLELQEQDPYPEDIACKYTGNQITLLERAFSNARLSGKEMQNSFQVVLAVAYEQRYRDYEPLFPYEVWKEINRGV